MNGMAGEYACQGYDLLSFLNLNDLDITVSNATANDCWGWVDEENGVEYAILGGRDRTIFIDINDPLDPQIIGYILTHTSPSLWRDIKVYQDHAFIVSEAEGHGMQVFDLTRLADVTAPPVEFEPDTHFGEFGRAHNIAINEESGWAYPVGARDLNGSFAFAGGPLFINISDPLNPFSVGGHDQSGYTHDAQVVTYQGSDNDYFGKEILFGCQGNSGFSIVDVSNKLEPQEIFQSSYEDQSYTHQGWLTPDQNYFIMNDEIDEIDFGFNTKTLIWDVHDLDNAFLVGSYTGPTSASDHNLYTREDGLVFMSNYTSGLRVAEMTDLSTATLNEVAYFDVWPTNDAAGYVGTWSNYPYFPSGNIIVSAFHGFYVLGQLPPSSIEENPSESYIIYPNPSNGSTMLSTRGDLSVRQIEIHDMSGRQVQFISTIPYQSSYSMNTSNLSPGVYFVRVNQDPATSRKLIIE